MTQTLDSTDQIRITLPDGSERAVSRGTSVLELAESIGPRLAKAAVAGKVNGEIVDLFHPLEEDAALDRARRVVAEEMPEHRGARAARVRPLGDLGELERTAEEDQAPRRRAEPSSDGG